MHPKTFTTMWFTLTAALLLAAALTTPAQAHWPRTVEENVAIAADPNVFESFPCALTLPNGRVLVAYQDYNVGLCYQIINRFGNFEMPPLTELAPGLPYLVDFGEPKAISDEQGGTYILWAPGTAPDSMRGVWAQRIDSLGNKLWGDAGIRIFPQRVLNLICPACSDGEGGLFLAVCAYTVQFPLYVQNIDQNGNLLWGPMGALVSSMPLGSTSMPAIASDLDGGCYVIWQDYREGIQRVYGQRLNSQGNLLWDSMGVYISEVDWGHKIIADGEGGIIEQSWVGDYNIHRRINRAGQILWTRDHLSYNNKGISLGDSGFFYLGYYIMTNWNTIFGQKVDLSGTTHWSPAIFYDRPGWSYTGSVDWKYCYPNYYFLGGVHPGSSQRYSLITQYLDAQGNRQLGEYGTTLSIFDIFAGGYYYLNVIPIEGNIIVVYHVESMGYDVWAKRCHADGTLGGPFLIGVTVTPHNPPIQIPPQGGSFTFDVAIADTDTVGGPFDAWIEVVLPGERTRQITARRHLNMPTGGTISKPNLTQIVPAYAPPGLYTYRVCAGDDSFKIPWGEGSFTFEKLGSGVLGLGTGRGVQLNALKNLDSGSRPIGLSGMTGEADGWTLSGDFFKEGVPVGAHGLPLRGMRPNQARQGVQLNAPTQPADLQLDARPNPFNPDIDISFTLSNAQHIELAIYDLRGSKVETLTDGILPPGLHTYNWNGERHSAGIYFVRLSTEKQSVVKKVMLVK